MEFYLQSKEGILDTTVARLIALSPRAILERGFSVTRVLPDYAVVKDVQQVNVGQHVEVTVSRGAMVCRMERKEEDGQANI
jgi:exodeoxyribonuclease VII large subunit